MRRALQTVWNVFRKGDLILLLLCVVTSAFGCLCIASATNHQETIRYVIIQAAAIMLGVGCYVGVSAIDLDFVSEHRRVLVVFNIFLLLLLIPFGVDFNSGNKSWLNLPLMPVSIQPAELCKITFVLILASVMASHQQRISSVKSVILMGVHLFILVGTNVLISNDAGVSLIFVFIFIGMAFAGGVSMIWFLIGGGALVVSAPIIWNYLMDEYQRKRFEVLWNPAVDPMGLKERYHSMRSLKSLTGGGLMGQGLFNGNRTQIGALPAQHTD